MLACLPYSLGWLTAAGATTVEHLYLSRLLTGVSHALLTTTIYTVEIASRDMRGTFCLMESVLRYNTIGEFFLFSKLDRAI